MDYKDLIPMATALVAAIGVILTSDRLRTIFRAIVREPKSSSVVIKLGNTTVSIDNASSEEVERLVEQFIKAQSTGEGDAQPDAPPTKPPGEPGADQ